MTVREIVIEKLKALGAEGLCNDDLECGCEIEDLCPCDSRVPMGCGPGRKVPCPEDCEYGGTCEFHMVPLESSSSSSATPADQPTSAPGASREASRVPPEPCVAIKHPATGRWYSAELGSWIEPSDGDQKGGAK
jgi:hypothetical protein